jgi:hypothetical protein
MTEDKKQGDKSKGTIEKKQKQGEQKSVENRNL